jgi:hypothetical protein
MTLAYRMTQVRVLQVLNPNGTGLRAGSLWRSGQLLFKAGHEGRHTPQHNREGGPLAVARDDSGRDYVIWKPEHPRARGLVIQPADSLYCYEACLEPITPGE